VRHAVYILFTGTLLAKMQSTLYRKVARRRPAAKVAGTHEVIP
jgi:hypothetical protein